ncbi:MAG: pseudouridine synthase [Saprospiraceae bacterium]|nr:pseudouridine synthase [Saprospiraceae bacterium]MDW8484824.1 pseudouridine synthase [Saprospiraceae bacterium]
MAAYRYFVVYKPYGVLSQFTPNQVGQRTLTDLGVRFPKDVYPVGRLDADSEGLLLLTNDPRLNARLLRPEAGHVRVYWTQVEGIPTEEALEALRRGVVIRVRGALYRTRPAHVSLLKIPPKVPPREPPIRFRKNIPDCWLEIALNEGKNRQIRRMCAAVGYPVLRLIRIQLGHLRLYEGELIDLQVGEVRELHATKWFWAP